MPVGVLVGLGALAVIGGVIVARVLANRGQATDDPASPAPAPAPTALDDDAPESPLAVRPVLEDPLDAPVRAPDVGVDAAPPDPEFTADPEIAHSPLNQGEAGLREHHRSPSGHLRILFSKEMGQPADGETNEE